jgi:hypothetical protein
VSCVNITSRYRIFSLQVCLLHNTGKIRAEDEVKHAYKEPTKLYYIPQGCSGSLSGQGALMAPSLNHYPEISENIALAFKNADGKIMLINADEVNCRKAEFVAEELKKFLQCNNLDSVRGVEICLFGQKNGALFSSAKAQAEKLPKTINFTAHELEGKVSLLVQIQDSSIKHKLFENPYTKDNQYIPIYGFGSGNGSTKNPLLCTTRDLVRKINIATLPDKVPNRTLQGLQDVSRIFVDGVYTKDILRILQRAKPIMDEAEKVPEGTPLIESKGFMEAVIANVVTKDLNVEQELQKIFAVAAVAEVLKASIALEKEIQSMTGVGASLCL